MLIDGKRIIRVFPRRTNATPDDDMAFIGDPPLFRPEADEVHVSCTFTWDQPEAERLARAWAVHYPTVWLGGPARNDAGADFVPGLYLKPGYVITSRGCPNVCAFCAVPYREGKLRPLPIVDGWDILDNNLLACPRRHVEAVLDMLEGQPKAARFTGGLEATRIEPWFIKRLVGLRLDIAFTAYDRPGQWSAVERAVAEIRAAGGWPDGTARRKIGCYVLIGYNGDSEIEAVKRLEAVVGLGATPFPMIYRPLLPSKDRKQEALKRSLRRWMRPTSIFADTKEHP